MDWTTATVDEDGLLTVRLNDNWEDDYDDDWLQAYQKADDDMGFVPIGTGGRARAKMISGAIQVPSVREGHEDAVRNHLDGLIHRANELAPREKAEREATERAEAQSERDAEARAQRMTEKFRRNRQANS